MTRPVDKRTYRNRPFAVAPATVQWNDVGTTLPPRLWGLLLGFISVAVFFVFVAIGMPQRGLIAAYSTFALSVSVRIKWDKRTATAFWPTVALMLLAHCLVVLLAFGPYERRPAAMYAPLTIADIFLIVWVLGRVARRT